VLEIRQLSERSLYVDNEKLEQQLQRDTEVIRITGCHLVVELMRQENRLRNVHETVARIVKLIRIEIRFKDIQVGFVL